MINQPETLCSPALLRVGAVVMASGSSRRFGSNKLLAPFCGRPLIAAALQIAGHSLITEKIAVTRTEEIQDFCRSVSFPCLLHSQPLLSDTIRLGLHALDGIDGCLFFQADQPLLSAESMEAMILSFCRNPHFIYQLSWQGQPGSPVLFPKTFFPELLQLPPDCGGSFVIRNYPQSVRYIEAQHPYELMDADTPDALAELEKLCHCSIRPQ